MEENKKIGILELTGYSVGNCVGTGIFVSMGLGIAFTGRSIPLALIIASIVVLFAYAFRPLLAGMFVLPGGKYSQQALLQPKLLIGVSAISNVLAGLGFAMFAIAIVDYAEIIFPQIAGYAQLISALIVSVFFLTTMLGAKFKGIFNVIMVGIMVISLSMFTIFGLPNVQAGVFDIASEGYFSGGAMGFVMAIACMAFACQGSSISVEMTADAKNPKRNVPISVLLATVIVAIFYCLLSIVASGVLPVEEVANESLGVVAEVILPYPAFVVFILGGACFAIATSLYSYIVSIQNPLLETINDGWLPAVFAKKTKNGYPYVMNAVLYIIAVVPIFMDMGVLEIISFTTIPTMILTIINNILCVPLVKKYPKAWKESFFHMPMWLFYVVIVLSVLSGLIIVVALFVEMEAGSQFAMIAMIAVLFLFSYLRLKSNKVDLKSIEQAKAEAEMHASETV